MHHPACVTTANTSSPNNIPRLIFIVECPTVYLPQHLHPPTLLLPSFEISLSPTWCYPLEPSSYPVLGFLSYLKIAHRLRNKQTTRLPTVSYTTSTPIFGHKYFYPAPPANIQPTLQTQAVP
jgi:hypothetical protein